jgi:hypothetical protein
LPVHRFRALGRAASLGGTEALCCPGLLSFLTLISWLPLGPFCGLDG